MEHMHGLCNLSWIRLDNGSIVPPLDRIKFLLGKPYNIFIRQWKG